MEFMNNQNRLRICIMQNSQTVFCVGFTIPFFLNNHFLQFSMTCFCLCRASSGLAVGL